MHKPASPPASCTTFDADLISRYDRAGPRYTSYPTAVQFSERFDRTDWLEAAARSNKAGGPLSLYLHIPFCHSLCYYCGCTKIVTRHAERADRYLDALSHEIALQAALFDSGRPVTQLHLGGGTPTFLRTGQIDALLDNLSRHFRLEPDLPHEYSIEIDPRSVDPQAITELAGLGFNRMSLGVQDFDANVQAAVNRIQSAAGTIELINRGRASGFASVSIDLIYGLPLQTVRSFDRTLDIVLDARPDRIAAYSYAHLPRMFRAQKLIREQDLPSPADKLAILGRIVDRLTSAGYVYIGMDHFALPNDDLVVAQQAGRLHRNFQGYSTHADCEMIGLGVSAIGRAGGSYAQNEKLLRDYYAALDDNRLPVARGLTMSADDQLRWAIIQQIMCHGYVDLHAACDADGNDPAEYFAAELADLEDLAKDGLVALDNGCVEVTQRGWFLVRVVAAVFDTYLRQARESRQFSRVI